MSSKARTKDEYRAAITKEDREVINFFYKFIDWLRKWMASEKPGLSTQTFVASIQTTEAFIDLSNYLLDEKNLEFILLGNIQSDYLERRFSWYRQSSGGNYHISVLQILQSEKTIRVRSLVEQSFHMKEIQNQ